jgi:hypothetical protein
VHNCLYLIDIIDNRSHDIQTIERKKEMNKSCNEWDCVHNKNGVCDTDNCPKMEDVLAIVHGRTEDPTNG